MSCKQFRRHKGARNLLIDLFADARNLAAIHYSCEIFYERVDGSSPRLTLIAVRNLESAQIHSFFIHHVAELKRIAFAQIDSIYDQIENSMLEGFFENLRKNSHFRYLHWNMRDINYGFQAIEHRFRKLGGDPFVLPDDREVDLSRLVISLYGVAYIGHPRLENIIKINKIEPRDFLSSKQEADAFTHKLFVNLHMSTLRKVDVFSNIAQRAYDGTLKTESKWRDARGLSLSTVNDIIQQNPIYSSLATIATVIGVLFWWL